MLSSLTSGSRASRLLTDASLYGSENTTWPARLFGDATYTLRTVLGLLLVAVLSGLAVAFAHFNALFICLSLVACIFIFLDFRIGVTLLIVLMPISASAVFPHSIGGITGLNPLNLLLLGTLASSLIQRPGSVGLMPFAPRPLIWRYVVPLTIAGVMGAPHVGEIPSYLQALGLYEFNGASSYLRDMLIKPLFMVLFAVLVGAALARSRHLEAFLLPMLFAVWCMGLMAIVFVYLSGASLGELASNRARGFFSPLGMHANDLGRCYATAYALMLFTFAATKDFPLRMALLASMGMTVIALILTFSRGAFLGFVVVNLLFLISRRQILPLLLGSIALAGMAFMLPGAVLDRLGMGWDSGLNVISAGRVDDIWLPLLPEVWSSPLFGHGIGAILWSDAMRAGSILQVSHPHNAYLQAALDMGIIGLLLLCSYFIGVWKGFRQLSRSPALDPTRRGFYAGAAAGLTAFLLTGFAGSSLMPVPEQSFLWLAIGMMYGEQANQAEHRHV